ncbi:hypothetical protein ACIP88_27995 [Streptomyces uncialis]|uniref:hypothetical protein n=1 Tax=Streptomyces uncialis TaxID=1048205 RepID=UPI0037F14CEF
MKRTTSPTHPDSRRPRGLRRTLAATALAALTLTAASASTATADSRDKPVGATEYRPLPPQAAFMDMMITVARQCGALVPDRPTSTTAERPWSGKPPAADPTLPWTDGVEPVADPTLPWTGGMEPSSPWTPKELALGNIDYCAGFLHVERVTQALDGIAEPTPAKVRKALNGLGYIDQRVHGLKQSGKKTHFLLDLRVLGGKLALKGTAAGKRTDVDSFVAPKTGPLKPAAKPVTPKPVASKPVTPKPAMPKPVTPKPVTPKR